MVLSSKISKFTGAKYLWHPFYLGHCISPLNLNPQIFQHEIGDQNRAKTVSMYTSVVNILLVRRLRPWNSYQILLQLLRIFFVNLQDQNSECKLFHT